MLFFKKKEKDNNEKSKSNEKKDFYFSRENRTKRFKEYLNKKNEILDNEIKEIEEYLNAIGWDFDTANFDDEKYAEYLARLQKEHDEEIEKTAREVVEKTIDIINDNDKIIDINFIKSNDNGVSDDVTSEDIKNFVKKAKRMVNTSSDSFISNDIMSETEEIIDKSMDEEENGNNDTDESVEEILANNDKSLAELIEEEKNTREEIENVIERTENMLKYFGYEEEVKKLKNEPKKITIVKDNVSGKTKKVIVDNKSKKSKRYFMDDSFKDAIDAVNNTNSAKELMDVLNAKNYGLTMDEDGDILSTNGKIGFHADNGVITFMTLKSNLIFNPNLSNQTYKNICNEIGLKVHTPIKASDDGFGKILGSKKTNGEAYGISISIENKVIRILGTFEDLDLEDEEDNVDENIVEE